MNDLIAVTRESEAPHSMYLRYADSAVTETISLDDDHYVNVDFATDRSVVGIEIVFPAQESLQLVADFARERQLSVAGVPQIAQLA
jgi:uncharacterized protein YuzE